MRRFRFLLAILMAMAWAQGAWAVENRKITKNNVVYRLVSDVQGMPWTQCLELVGVENSPTSVYIPLSVEEGGVTYSYHWYSGVPGPLFFGIKTYSLPYYLWEEDWFVDDVTDNTLYNQRLEEHIQSLTQSTSSVTTLSVPLDPIWSLAGFQNVEFLNVYSQGSTGTALGSYLMNGRTKLQRVEYPESVTIIDEGCFNGCTSLSNFTLNNCIERIGDKAFYNCRSLSSSSFFDNCTDLVFIGNSAFSGCTGLTKITLNKDISVGAGAFENCTGITQATFNGKPILGGGAFKNCSNLTSVTFNDEVTLWGVQIFEGCSSLTDITINSLNPQSHEDAFNYGALQHLTITKMSSLVYNMLICRNCSQLRTINFPAAFFQQSQLAEGYFEGCTNLTQELVFSNLNYIGSKTFAGINGINLKLTNSGGINVAADAFQNTTGTLYVRYGLRDYYSTLQATKHLNIVEYDAPNPKAYMEVAGESLTSWYGQYTTSQLSAVKRLKVTGSLTTDSYTVLAKMCGNGSTGLSLTSLDLTEVTNDVIAMFPSSQALDTLMLPRAATGLGNNFFNSFKSSLVVVAPWTEPIALPMPGTVSGKTLIVPRGSLYAYRAATGWKGFGTIKTEPLEGNENLLVISGKANKPVELWVDGELIGEIAKHGGSLSESVDGSASVELRVPTQYLDKILFNGADVKTVLTSSTPTDATYEGYKCYYIEDFTPTTAIEVAFTGLPEVFETYGLAFFIDGGPGTANAVITYGDGTSESLDMEHDGEGSTILNHNYYAVLHSGRTYATTKEIENIVVTAHPENDEPSIMWFNPGYANKTQSANNEDMYTLDYNGSGTYTYTLPGENMTSSNIYMYFPPTQENNIKTTIAVNGNYQVKYFFFDFDPGLWYHNVKTSDDYIQGQTTVTHNGSSDSYGQIFIFTQNAGVNPPFRVILNGEVVQCGTNTIPVSLRWETPNSYNDYIQSGAHIDDCYILSIADTNIASDSWIIIDDGTTPLDQIVSPWQITQNVNVIGDGILSLRNSEGTEVAAVTEGETTTVNWPKGDNLTLAVTLPDGADIANYQAILIIDGTESELQKVNGAFSTFDMGSIATAHNIVLITRQTGGSNKLLATVIPNGLSTSFVDYTADKSYWSDDVTTFEFSPGSNLKVNTVNSDGNRVIHYYVNGVDRTEEVESDGLHLDGVNENLTIEVKSLAQHLTWKLCNTHGGSTTVYYQNGGGTFNAGTNLDICMSRTDADLNSELRLVLKPDAGYEPLFFYKWQREVAGESVSEEQAIASGYLIKKADGSYEFKLPASMMEGEEYAYFTVIYVNPNAGDLERYDVNRDGKITIADVTALVNKILGKE